MITSWTCTFDDPLSQLAAKYGTDKLKWYTSFYHELLKDRRDAKKILELGIGSPDCMPEGYKTGASLRMWEEYFPQATIYGLDHSCGTLINEGRIKSFFFQQSYENTYPLQELGTGFDLIVDDASHKWYDQLKALGILSPLTSLYIIEDTGYMTHNEARTNTRFLNKWTNAEFVPFWNPNLPAGDRGSCIVVWP